MLFYYKQVITVLLHVACVIFLQFLLKIYMFFSSLLAVVGRLGEAKVPLAKKGEEQRNISLREKLVGERKG